MTAKTKKQLQAELDAANKRCADLADALVKALMAQPVIVPFVLNPSPPAIPAWPMYPPYISPTVQPFSEPWVITTCGVQS